VNTNRPVNLELSTMRFPIMAITSILHRLSGIGIFILLPYMLCLLHCSLTSEKNFSALQRSLQSPWHKVLILIFLAAMIYHLCAGIRHILMDIGYGEHVQSGRRSAAAVIVIAAILTLLAGVWLW
jgi:succinate dehydrogenase cytochrome b subunit